MIFGMNGQDASLLRQLEAAESQLTQRQRQLHEDIQAVDASVRERLTSPDVLLWGAGSGFILGELTRKRRPEPAERQQHAARQALEEEVESPGILQLLLHYLAIARPIISSVHALLGPYIQGLQIDAAARAQQAAMEAANGPPEPARATQQTA
ncbi:hypothetical protein VVD49_01700 [Uliginosibacterium sp. H3]|uniref:Uncharacterized protein n=1 Tax=Uliginosibacterium silvisoli TaxID=3114758 RepID=A0ABU6JYJ9_9RHOO|nr:hypothetical protein [Uliginosibacterium sp. H3]